MKTNIQLILQDAEPPLTADEEKKLFKRYVVVKQLIATWGPDCFGQPTGCGAYYRRAADLTWDDTG